MKRLLFLMPICIIGIFTLCMCTACQSKDDTAPTESNSAAVESTVIFENELFYELKKEAGTLDVVMFRVGNADAILFSTENCNLLLDTGEKNDFDADKILAYCASQNITALDAVIVSNVLTDNIGGYEKICKELAVTEVIAPFYNATGHRYTKFLRTVLASGAALTNISEVTARTWDDVSITFYPAANPVVYDTEEDMSLVLALTHGDNTMLFCGNIRELRIAEVTETITDTFDVVKLPDHGFFFDGMDAFLDQYAPQYVMISDSAKNSVTYDLLSMLADKNITYYRTADAYICARSDGKKLTFTQN